MSEGAPRGLIVAGASSHSGKTLVTTGLIGGLRRSGMTVSAAKCGPDYIDPRFLEAASGRPAINLDPWAMDVERLAVLAQGQAAGSDILVVEGVMGLYDGGSGGNGSTAALARHLNLPVVIIVDGQGTAQTAAAVADGLANQAKGFDVIGAIVNRCASERHRALIEEGFANVRVPLLGTIFRDAGINVPSRHLGLVQAGEHGGLDDLVENASGLVSRSIDLAALHRLAGSVIQPPFSRACFAAETSAAGASPPGQTIAVARDVAFAFAYPHMLQEWHSAGAAISTFSPLADEAPDPSADFIFLPGGYPELHAGELASAQVFRAGMSAAAERGARIYGECGGFMVLGESIRDAEGRDHAMLGLLPLATTFAERQLHLGYRSLDPLPGCPWDHLLKGHEFHYAKVFSEGPADRLFAACTGDGDAIGEIGLRWDNVMGSFAHVIDGL